MHTLAQYFTKIEIPLWGNRNFSALLFLFQSIFPNFIKPEPSLRFVTDEIVKDTPEINNFQLLSRREFRKCLCIWITLSNASALLEKSRL